MLILITHSEINSKTGKKQIIVSHGIDYQTDKTVILPCEPISHFTDAEYNETLMEYVIYNNKAEKELMTSRQL